MSPILKTRTGYKNLIRGAIVTDAADNVVNIHDNVAKELLDQMNALYGLAKTHQCLTQGTYQINIAKHAEQAAEFIHTLHAQVLEQALAHPDAAKIATLQTVLENRAKAGEAPNEQA